jgi:hypothetical protein
MERGFVFGQTVRPPLMGLANGRGVPPVFGFEEEAGLFARLSRRGGRSVLRIGIDELVSLLCGPLGGVDLVALDPVSDAEADVLDGSASLTRQRFLDFCSDRGAREGQGKALRVWPRRPGPERTVKPVVVVPTCGAEALKIA